jgi:hypothetical protein
MERYTAFQMQTRALMTLSLLIKIPLGLASKVLTLLVVATTQIPSLSTSFASLSSAVALPEDYELPP